MKKNTPKKSYWKHWLIGSIIVGALAFILILSSMQQPKQPIQSFTTSAQQETIYSFSEEEAKTLTNELLAATVPSLPVNSYFTPLMREKLSWVADEYAAKRLLLSAIGTYYITKAGNVQKGVLMGSNYTPVNHDNKLPYKPFIEIYTPRLLMLVRVQQKVQVGFNQMCKNTFALGLVHEAVHLEKGETYYTNPRSDEEILKEEARAWVKVGAGAIRQLRQAGQPLDTDYIESDDIMQRCGYKTNCPEFLDYLKREGKAAIDSK